MLNFSFFLGVSEMKMLLLSLTYFCGTPADSTCELRFVLKQCPSFCYFVFYINLNGVHFVHFYIIKLKVILCFIITEITIIFYLMVLFNICVRRNTLQFNLLFQMLVSLPITQIRIKCSNSQKLLFTKNFEFYSCYIFLVLHLNVHLLL